MMTLLETVKNQEVPADLRCRQIFPTNGTRSSSLWDAPDQESLQNWLDEAMVAECNSEVFQVQEEAAFGISAELTRIRATERVAANTRATAAAVQERTKTAAAGAQHRMGELDAKLKVSEHASAAYKSARDTSSAAARRTAEMFGKVGQQAQTSYSKALENDRIAAAALAINSNVSAGWRTISSGFGNLVKPQANAQTTTAGIYGEDGSGSDGAPTSLGKNGAKETAPSGASQSSLKDEKRGSLFTLDDSDEVTAAPKAGRQADS